ncbi:membrane-bound lytic murein transglycosylase MltF [Marinimicrobium alkaliphilum]|uniref:membrane-bound lytic murein transglycosylase MltF n=1 Tax=Marinimicrobium alkaliphilum TaxID=2202654 RepID=UPI000DB93BA8|nr:membrane-bound lytic murein transglycosylase MltF [Marinimicrobium alkaliphilum]
MDMNDHYAPARFSFMNAIGGLLFIGISALLTGSATPATLLERLLAQGELRVLSRNGPTTYYEGPYGRTGFEYYILQGFADELGLELVIEDEEKLDRMIDRIAQRQSHFAAAGLTVTKSREHKVHFSLPYKHVTQQLIYNSRTERPSTLEDLTDKKLLVIAGSSHAERLAEYKEIHPALSWEERDALEMIDLLEMVHKGEIDYAVVDSNAYKLNRNVFPRAQVAFDVGTPQALAWAFPKGRDRSLLERAEQYLARIQHDGSLAQLEAELYDHIDEINTGGALLFAYRLEHRLPRWEEEMRTAAETFDLDWHLLAAISYQESHWNANARSRTGVRGLMMLTQAAAQDMGVTNRLDPTQSIYGGAKYYRWMYDRLAPEVTGEDRTWMALAAYNVGLGHLEDARTLTLEHGGDPNRWTDVSQYLPLLARRQYYRETRFGYARGWEPVTYVRNIRNFYNIIALHDQQEQRRLAMARHFEEEALLEDASLELDERDAGERRVPEFTASMSVL